MFVIKITASLGGMGGYFCVLMLAILAKIIAGTEKIKRKTQNLNHIHDIHPDQPPFHRNSPKGFYIIRGHSPLLKGLTAYRYGSTHIPIIATIARKNNPSKFIAK